jgi:hypothetical protein
MGLDFGEELLFDIVGTNAGAHSGFLLPFPLSLYLPPGPEKYRIYLDGLPIH